MKHNVQQFCVDQASVQKNQLRQTELKKYLFLK